MKNRLQRRVKNSAAGALDGFGTGCFWIHVYAAAAFLSGTRKRKAYFEPSKVYEKARAADILKTLSKIRRIIVIEF